MIKRIVSVLMSVLLLLSVISIAASAQQEVFYLDDIIGEKTHNLHTASGNLPTNEYFSEAVPRYSNFGAGAFNFFSALDNYQKAIYNSIVADKGGLYKADASSTSATLSPVTLSIPRDEYDDIIDNNRLGEIIFGAWSAVSEDYPEFFWLYSCGATNISVSGSSNGYSITLSPAIDSINTNAYANWGVVRNYYNGMLAAIDSFRVVGGNRYQQLKSIHDQICNMVSYDYEFDNPIAHEPTGVFFAPFEPVCEGYAEAFKLICDKVGIPCIGVVGDGYGYDQNGAWTGEGHKWNYVKMDDGKWYGMDLTWDDQRNIMYDYFLVGTNTKNAFFKQRTFGDDHIATGEGFNGYILTYPTLSTTSYSLAIPNQNSTLSFDAINNRVYFGKNATLRSEFFALCNYSSPAQISGQTVTVSGTTTEATTGATVTVNNGGLTKVYTAVRRGDVDADDLVNATDYGKMKNTVSGSDSGLTENTAGYWAGDFDDDGSVDAFDLFWMDMYLNDNIEY